jgi:RNAse (barnase) inhibitor barstar
MLNLFAKGSPQNPYTAEEQAEQDAYAADTRTIFEKWEDTAKEFGIAEMSDEELQSLWDTLSRSDDRMQPVIIERQKRADAKDTRTIEQKYADADPSVWH